MWLYRATRRVESAFRRFRAVSWNSSGRFSCFSVFDFRFPYEIYSLIYPSFCLSVSKICTSTQLSSKIHHSKSCQIERKNQISAVFCRIEEKLKKPFSNISEMETMQSFLGGLCVYVEIFMPNSIERYIQNVEYPAVSVIWNLKGIFKYIMSPEIWADDQFNFGEKRDLLDSLADVLEPDMT
jgi:hypothetical protein